MEDRIILVDEQDQEIGSEEKLAAHRTPMLHRAFSIFLYDDDGPETRVLLQQRALDKYHSGGLWANSCCSHPRVGEVLEEATVRRLEEELGVTGVRLREVGSFVYFHRFREDLYEFEYDHVFIGRYAGDVTPNPEEIAQVRWFTVPELQDELTEDSGRPEGQKKFAPWFPMAAAYALHKLIY